MTSCASVRSGQDQARTRNALLRRGSTVWRPVITGLSTKLGLMMLPPRNLKDFGPAFVGHVHVSPGSSKLDT